MGLLHFLEQMKSTNNYKQFYAALYPRSELQPFTPMKVSPSINL